LERELASAQKFAPHVTLTRDDDVAASLVALCEGRDSTGRAALGVAVERHDYGHRAVAARLTASRPHAHTARQWFRSPDVLALLIAERERWRDVGDEKIGRRYSRERRAPTWAMALLTDGLLQLFAHPMPAVRELRNRALTLVNHLPVVKRWLTARALDS